LSEPALTALADYGQHVSEMPPNGGDCEAVLTRYIQAGIDIDALAAKLQQESIEAKVRSWFDLLSAIAYKSAALSSNHHHDRLAES
jgi:transaldolase